MTYRSVFGRCVCLFYTERDLTISQSCHLEHNLSHSRPQINKFVLTTYGMEFVKDLANQLKTRFSVHLKNIKSHHSIIWYQKYFHTNKTYFRSKSLIMVEQIGIRNGFVVTFLQHMLQMWSWTTYWETIQFSRWLLFTRNVLFDSLIVSSTKGVHGFKGTWIVQAHRPIFV